MKRLLPLLLLTACATTEPRIEVREVKVPVALPCVSDRVSDPPVYPDTDEALKAAPDAAARFSLLAAGRVLRNQRLRELEPVIKVCRIPSRQVDGGR